MIALKKAVCLIVCVIVLLGCCSCNPTFKATVEELKYEDYLVVGNEVHYMCYVTIKSNKDTAVRITSTVNSDFESGFLVGGELVAYDSAKNTDTIVLAEGTNVLSLIFVGRHNPGMEKDNSDGPSELNIIETEYDIPEEEIPGVSSATRIYSNSKYSDSTSSAAESDTAEE